MNYITVKRQEQIIVKELEMVHEKGGEYKGGNREQGS